MPKSADQAAEFRERAEELRNLASLVRGQRNREMLLKCATDYDTMASQYEVAEAQVRHSNALRPKV